MKKFVLCGMVVALLAGAVFLSRDFFYSLGFPVIGSGALRDPRSLVDLVSKAKKEEGRLVIPPGVYRLCDTDERELVIQKMRRTTIIAHGVTIVFKTGQSLVLNECEDVKLEGLSVDYDPVPFTQGTITKIDPAEKSLTVVLDDGYPSVESLPKSAHVCYAVFDPVRLKERPLPLDYFRNVSAAGERTYKCSQAINGFLFDAIGRPESAQAGDKIALCKRSGIAIAIKGCTRVRLEGVTVFTSPGYAFWEVDGEGGNHYKQCRIVKKPATNRLVTTVADGFHSYHVRKGPVIEDCEFHDTVDDTIAIHGFFSIVLESPSARVVYLVSPFGRDFFPGGELSFHEMPHGRVLGKAFVKSVVQIAPSTLSQPVAAVRQSFLDQNFHMRDLPVTQALKVELDRDVVLPAGKFVLASSSAQCGSGAIVRNNTLRGGHVRGVIFKADDVLVEGNRFEDIGANAILVSPELGFLEGPIPKGATIRGNTITHCGWKVLSPRHANPGIGGAIQTSTWLARRSFPPQFDPYPLIRDVSISHNVIRDSGSYGIVLGNVLSGQISGNIIERPFSKPGSRESQGLAKAFDSREHPLEKPSDPRACPAGILVYGSKDVVLSGNAMTPPVEKGGVPPLVVGPWCGNIETNESAATPR